MVMGGANREKIGGFLALSDLFPPPSYVPGAPPVVSQVNEPFPLAAETLSISIQYSLAFVQFLSLSRHRLMELPAATPPAVQVIWTIFPGVKVPEAGPVRVKLFG